jgi:hypothetical protein
MTARGIGASLGTSRDNIQKYILIYSFYCFFATANEADQSSR